MMIHPFFNTGTFAPIVITARQWQAAKQRATQFGDNKNRPGKWTKTRFNNAVKTLTQGAALMGVGKKG
jgi:hypothetical protein